MNGIDSIYRHGQHVTIEIDGELMPGHLTVSNTPGFWFAVLADGTATGQISETRLSSVTTLKHDDYLRVADARWQNHTISTLSGYGAKYGDYEGTTGLARYQAALERNKGKAVWLNAEAVVISAHAEAQPTRHYVRSGDLVRVESTTPGEGGWYRITKPGRMDGDHCQLIRVN
jgi:hypothetical protein